MISYENVQYEVWKFVMSRMETNIEFEQGVFLVDKTFEESQLAMRGFWGHAFKGLMFYAFLSFICSVDP